VEQNTQEGLPLASVQVKLGAVLTGKTIRITGCREKGVRKKYQWADEME
jgi:hypothetical protein